MNITTQAQNQVAEFLEVAQELVLEVREWANVLWVKVQGCRPRFVSKKVIKMSSEEKFAQLKDEVIARFNETAWLHLKKWTSDFHGLNDDWYLSKIRPEGRAEFQAFAERLYAIELEIAKKDDAEEKARLETFITPEQEDERKARAAMWLPH